MDTVVFALSSKKNRVLSKMVGISAVKIARDLQVPVYSIIGNVEIPRFGEKVLFFTDESEVSDSIKKVLKYAQALDLKEVIVVCDDLSLAARVVILSPPNMNISHHIIRLGW
ncbi:MAG TPA: hypothetical protein VJ900_00055 [Patescibacteria group bacterium]|nr:hypothetical protein [Patescibacteria group bacterium]